MKCSSLIFLPLTLDIAYSSKLIFDCHHQIKAFHPQTNMAELSLTKENKLVLQDRASCLPPCILDIKKNDIVLDCCAAPGNKTHQLAERGKSVLACEADPKRFKGGFFGILIYHVFIF